MDTKRKLLLFTFIFLAIAGSSVLMTLALQRTAAVVEYATVLPKPMALPQFDLIDQSGDKFGRESLESKWSALFFGFTHCPDICPATLQQLALARQRVNEITPDQFPNIILVSVDPERDTPEILKEYVSHFGEGVKGVTGSVDEVRKLTSALGIFFEKSGQLDANYNVNHSAVVIIVDPNAEFHALFSAPHKVEQFVNDIPTIVGAL